MKRCEYDEEERDSPSWVKLKSRTRKHVSEKAGSLKKGRSNEAFVRNLIRMYAGSYGFEWLISYRPSKPNGHEDRDKKDGFMTIRVNGNFYELPIQIKSSMASALRFLRENSNLGIWIVIASNLDRDKRVRDNIQDIYETFRDNLFDAAHQYAIKSKI